MLDYVIALVFVTLVAVVPALRRGALSVLGLSAIAAVAIAGIALPVWGLYEAKSWLTGAAPEIADVSEKSRPGHGSETGAAEKALSEAKKAEQRRMEDERQKRAEEQRRLEEELQRIADLAEEARIVVENDRKYAEIAADSPRMPGIDQVSTDLIAIRIPSWRDEALAEREMELIRAWLISIGLTPEETAMIVTAKAWGTLYDLWQREITSPADRPAPDAQAPAVADSEEPPQAEPLSEAEPEPDPQAEPPPEPEPARATAAEPEYIPFAPLRQAERPVVQPRPQPRQALPAAPQIPERRRPPAQERELGPFGY